MKTKLISLSGLTEAHKALIELYYFTERDGEMYDSHFEYLSEIFYNHLSKENEAEGKEAIIKLKDLMEIALMDIENQAKQHLINFNRCAN